MGKQEIQKKFFKVKNIIDKDFFHIFLISNPIFELISYVWINKLGLDQNKIILIRLREPSTSLFKGKYKYFKKTLFDRLCKKLNYDNHSRKILKWTSQNFPNYYIYCARLNQEAEKLINHQNCRGHFYIEEGQISHNRKQIFEKNYKGNLRELNKPIFAADKEYHFRKDAILFIGIDNHVFPLVESEKKIILDDLNLVKNVYKPQLIGIEKIALVPAPRRIQKINFDKFLEIFINSIPKKSCIKFHPGFQYSDSKLEELENHINSKFNTFYRVCRNNVIIEIEMMFEKKCIFGSKSSLEIYTKKFGSSYNNISLY